MNKSIEKSSTTIPKGSTTSKELEKVALFKFYVLIDPNDNLIKYIGRTVNLENRFRNHISESKKRNRNRKERWIVSLLRKNMKPIIKVIYSLTCDIKEAILTEKMLYKKLSKRFQLKNEADAFLGNILMGKPVFQYDLTGKYVNWYHNSNQAYLKTNIKDCNILRCCNSAQGYGTKSAGNYLWSFNKYDVYPYKYIKKDSSKIVLVYDLNNVFLGEYANARIASKNTNVSYKKISAVCNGRQKTANKLIFKFK